MKKYDLIVVGGGTAGLSAAAHTAEPGKTALVLESLPKLGGNGVFAPISVFGLSRSAKCAPPRVC